MAAEIEHRRVQANGIEFHVAIAGPADGPAILCLHGFPEGWESWRPVMEALPEVRIYAPDLRGYGGSDRPKSGYDVFTLTADVLALVGALGLDRPLLLTHDWGGALGWIFAHRYPGAISRLAVVNCPHPRTLLRAVLRFEDWQTLRIPWVPAFMVPRMPEAMLATRLGRSALRLSFTAREGRKGTMDRDLVDDLVDRFQRAEDMRPPIDWYREMVATVAWPRRRKRLFALYRSPIQVPVTLIWGEKDGALSAKVARKSGRDARCEVEWRPLPRIGHFVMLEAAAELAAEVRRLLPVPNEAPAATGP